MKKLLTVLLAALMLIAFAGCGNDKTNEKSSASADSVSSKSNTDSTEKYATAREFLDDPVNLEGMDEIKDAMGDTIDVSVYADGKTIVYDYKFLTEIDSSTLGTVKDTLDNALDAYDETYKKTVSEIQNKVDEDITLRVVYHTCDGTVITERTYKP